LWRRRRRTVVEWDCEGGCSERRLWWRNVEEKEGGRGLWSRIVEKNC
jgi:hypothetical protein